LQAGSLGASGSKRQIRYTYTDFANIRSHADRVTDGLYYIGAKLIGTGGDVFKEFHDI
jgi:hypothetical protein